MADDSSGTGSAWKKLTEGAMGAGLVLVVMPCVALYFGMATIHAYPWSGLPVLAVFGIMILFGALALVSTLFARLSLADAKEPLALPPGSIRATIALSLIVLFAIIAIMLYHSLDEPYEIGHLGKDEKDSLVAQPVNRVLAVLPDSCPAGASAPTGCFKVHLVQTRGQASVDLAKQLLILIGTLMTSVTSYYFAARSAAAPRPDSGTASDKTPSPGGTPATPAGAAPVVAAAAATVAAPGDEEHRDGCDLPITDGTPDEELPPAKGGVA